MEALVDGGQAIGLLNVGLDVELLDALSAGGPGWGYFCSGPLPMDRRLLYLSGTEAC